jgi:hypothetical protein
VIFQLVGLFELLGLLELLGGLSDWEDCQTGKTLAIALTVL